MKILITGHKGFIGKKILDKLQKTGYNIRGIDLKDGEVSPSGYLRRRPPQSARLTGIPGPGTGLQTGWCRWARQKKSKTVPDEAERRARSLVRWEG